MRTYLRNSTIKPSTKRIPRVSKRKDSVSAAKAKAWKAFSDYIKLRDALKATGTAEIGQCYTCKRDFPINKMQSGHFVQGRRNPYLFDERGVHAQCAQCNVFLHGNWPLYLTHMRMDYGDDVVAEMIDLYSSKQATPIKAFVYEEVEAKYKAKYKDLLEGVK